MEWFSFIHRHKFGWPNHIKTLCTFVLIILSLYSWINFVCMKVFTDTTNWYQRSKLKTFRRADYYRAHKTKTKEISDNGRHFLTIVTNSLFHHLVINDSCCYPLSFNNWWCYLHSFNNWWCSLYFLLSFNNWWCYLHSNNWWCNFHSF